MKDTSHFIFHLLLKPLQLHFSFLLILLVQTLSPLIHFSSTKYPKHFTSIKYPKHFTSTNIPNTSPLDTNLTDLSTQSSTSVLRQSTRPTKLPAWMINYVCGSAITEKSTHWCNLVSYSSLPTDHKAYKAEVASLKAQVS